MKRLIEFLVDFLLPPFIVIALLLAFVSFLYLKDFDTNEHIVAVIDSGVDRLHEQLKGRVLHGFDFVDFDRDATDYNGHGTSVAGIIASESPKSYILPVRNMDTKGAGQIGTIVPIIYSIMKGADVINMSFTESKHDRLTQMVINLASKKGIIMVAATGNEGKNVISYPSKYDNVLSVAAIDKNKKPFEGNNVGNDLDYFALGVSVKAPVLHNGYGESTGTSIASATATGVISYLQTNHPELSDKEVLEKLNETSQPLLADKNYKVIFKDEVISSSKSLTKANNLFETPLTIQSMGILNGEEYIQICLDNIEELEIMDAKHNLVKQSTPYDNQLFVSLSDYTFPLTIDITTDTGSVIEYLYNENGELSTKLNNNNRFVSYNTKK